MIDVGVIGAGQHSRTEHGPALQECHQRGLANLRAICDLNRDRAESYADRFGIDEVYTDMGEMQSLESLDAIVAITPAGSTREVGGELLTGDLPVLLEKPPGQTVAEAEALATIADEHETPHMISFNRRFNPAISKGRQWLEDRDLQLDYLLARLERVERTEPEFLIGTGIHAIDTVCSQLPAGAFDVSSFRWRTVNGGQSARAHLSGLVESTILLTPDAGRRVETYELIGGGFSLRIDTHDSKVAAWRDGDPVFEWRPPESMPAYERNGTLDEMRSFLQAVRSGKKFAPTLRDGVRAMRIAEIIDEGGTGTVSLAG